MSSKDIARLSAAVIQCLNEDFLLGNYNLRWQFKFELLVVICQLWSSKHHFNFEIALKV
jgi:hypothetical protein